MIKIEIETSNAAFEDNPCGEVARILRDIASRVEQMSLDEYQTYNLRDVNGNTVGFYENRS